MVLRRELDESFEVLKTNAKTFCGLIVEIQVTVGCCKPGNWPDPDPGEKEITGDGGLVFI